MDFEILSESPQKPLTLLQFLERLIANRRRQWQLWGEKPPYILALVLLLTVSLEITLSQRLLHNLGGGIGLIQQLYGTIFLILLCETFFVYAASRGAQMVGKEGSFLAAMTYLNLSLTPFLLILPMTVLTWVTGDSTLHMVRLLLIVALSFKVISLWKQSIEHVFKLTAVQSGLVLYAAVGATVVVASLFVYIGLIRTLSNLISG